MNIANRVVRAVSASPMHRIISGSVDVVRYVGRRSGRTISTPTQYARRGDDVLILVGRPAAKNWWRNFRQDHDLDVLLRGHWTPMIGRAVVGADDPERITPLLDAYLARFPKAVRALEGNTDESRARGAVIVWCRPR
jgi:F420H(2)-dependent quinone reductase